jgi:3-oxoadipate enol-lactonase
MPLLADDIRVISYDQRDVGDSWVATGPYGAGDLADDCVELMDALDIEQAHVMGISFGGAIALHVGLRHPDRVRSLIVGAAPDTFQRPNPFLERVFTASEEDREALMLDSSLSPEAQRDQALRATLDGLDRDPVMAEGSHRRGALLMHKLSEDEVGRISVPTLLVYGEDDPIVPPDRGRMLHDWLPNSELVLIPEARHGLSFEFRHQLADLVNGWVADHPIGR